MAIKALLRDAPIGTVVSISIRVPRQNDDRPDGFAYTVTKPMSADALRAAVDSELLPKFFDQFLPAL